jgi:RNA polymerase sigma factor, sigma-70 family
MTGIDETNRSRARRGVPQGALVHIARRLHGRLGLAIDLEDIEQMAIIWMLEARERWDPEEQPDFMAFAYYRIRGAILDGLRGVTGVSRNQAARIRRVRAATHGQEALSVANQALGPDDYAAAAIANASFLADLADTLVTSSELSGEQDDIGSDGLRADPEAIARRRERRALVRTILGRLEPRERAVLEHHYFQNRSLSEFGDDHGISRSWASRIHANALDAFRAQWKLLDRQRSDS